jgi:histidinol-phosphatase (PHP family)
MFNVDTKTDGHVHTKYCGHATGEMEEFVLAGLSKGLERLIFLEHLEVGISYFESTWLSVADFDKYWQEGMALKKKYSGRIDIGLGVEVGYNPASVQEIINSLNCYQWDRIGISYHFMKYEGRHINLLSRKKINMLEFSKIGVDLVLTRYLEGLLDAVRKLPGNVLCHLDAALRHHDDVKYEDNHLELMDQIINEAASQDMALEINTSGFPLRGESFPSVAIIKKAQQLGMKLVAGSDAHRPDAAALWDGTPDDDSHVLWPICVCRRGQCGGGQTVRSSGCPGTDRGLHDLRCLCRAGRRDRCGEIRERSTGRRCDV